jgi:hypothetical protein
VLLALGGGLVAVVTVLLAARPPSYAADGPLQAEAETRVEFALASDAVATWGMTLPLDPTVSDITVESIDPLGMHDLDILGVVVSRPDVDGSIVNARGFPPEGMKTTSPRGAILPAVGSADPRLEALVGVRRAAGASSGGIGSLRVRYLADGRPYEVTLPWSLQVGVDVGGDPAPGASSLTR